MGGRVSDGTKWIKNNKAPGADSFVNEFLKYIDSEVGNQILEIMNAIFEKGEVPSDFKKILIKPLYNKGDKSDCGNNRGIILVYVGSKLVDTFYTDTFILSMILLILRYAVDKLIRGDLPKTILFSQPSRAKQVFFST